MNIKLQTNEQLSATVANGLAGVFINGVSLSASLSGKADLTALQNCYVKSETSSANEISTALENTGGKVYFDNRVSGITGSNDLSVVKLSAAEYAQMLDDGTCISNAIYIVDAPNIDAFKQQIKNVAPPTDLSDAATKEYVDTVAGNYLLSANETSSVEKAKINVVTKAEYLQLSADNQLISSEIYAIDENIFDEQTKITVQKFGNNDQIVTEQTDLSILCLSSMDQLADYVAKDKLADNAIYRVKSDYETAFGKRLTDIADPISAQDAVTLRYLQQNTGTMKFSEIVPMTEDQYTYHAWLDDNTVNAIFFSVVGGQSNITFHVPSKQSAQNQSKMRNFVLYLESFAPIQQMISFKDDSDNGSKITDFCYTSQSDKLNSIYNPQSGNYVFRFLEIDSTSNYSKFLIDCTRLMN